MTFVSVVLLLLLLSRVDVNVPFFCCCLNLFWNISTFADEFTECKARCRERAGGCLAQRVRATDGTTGR